MGNSNQQSSSQLKFIQQLEDKHFGEVDIYRTEEGRVVMKMTRTHILGDKRQQQFQRIVEWTLKESNPCLVPIIHITNQQEKGICIQYQVAHIFTEYYNYTLQDLINSKKDIEEAQLWCLLESLLRLITILRRNKLSINLSLNNVFLTLKGMPCIYLYHIRSIEESITYNQYGMGQQLAKILLQLGTNQNITDAHEDQDAIELLGVLSKLCHRYKLFGKVIKQLLNREKGQQQALQEIELMLEKGKVKKASEVKLNRFKYLIPQSGNSIQSQVQKYTDNFSKNPKPVYNKPKKNQQIATKEIIHPDSIKRTDTKKKNSRQTTESKEILQEFSQSKGNQMVFSKQQATKMLIELDRRKEDNRLQMQKFQIKKEELLHHSEKQNKQNSYQNLGQKQHNQSKAGKEQSERRLAQIRKNSRRR